jgi:hypothetical protein
MSSRLHPLALSLLLLTACGSTTDAGDDDDAADAAPGADADPNGPDADPDAPDADPAATCQFDDGVRYDLLAETVQLESAGGGTCVKLTRRNDCPPDFICKAVPFTLLTFRTVHDGAVAYIDDEGAMHWEATHHNWNDWGEATGGGVRYRLESRYTDGFTDRYELFAYDAATAALRWGPVELVPYAP